MVNTAMQAPPINMHTIKVKKKWKGAEGGERERARVDRCTFYGLFLSVNHTRQ